MKMPHTTIALPVRRPPAKMPDADTDVLIWEDGWPEAQLGAYTGHDEAGPLWANAQGERVHVVAWAELPVLGYVQEIRPKNSTRRLWTLRRQPWLL